MRKLMASAAAAALLWAGTAQAITVAPVAYSFEDRTPDPFHAQFWTETFGAPNVFSLGALIANPDAADTMFGIEAPSGVNGVPRASLALVGITATRDSSAHMNDADPFTVTVFKLNGSESQTPLEIPAGELSATFSLSPIFGYALGADGGASFSDLLLVPGTGVPEGPLWAMWFLGLGAAGALVRSQRRDARAIDGRIEAH